MTSQHYIKVLDEIGISNLRKVFFDGSCFFSAGLGSGHSFISLINYFKTRYMEVLNWPGNVQFEFHGKLLGNCEELTLW